jgi:hypothetical protein
MEKSSVRTDKEGRPLAVGSKVVIPSIPEWLTAGLPVEDVEALRKMEGATLSVMEIDEHGYLWFGANGQDSRWFCLRPEEVTSGDANASIHSSFNTDATRRSTKR